MEFYEFGLFQQAFENSHQVEHPDSWNRYGTPWEVIRPEYVQKSASMERCSASMTTGNYVRLWSEARHSSMSHDLPIPGYDTETVNFLRLWESKASRNLTSRSLMKGAMLRQSEKKLWENQYLRFYTPTTKLKAEKSSD